MHRSIGLSGLALRQGLALVLFAWGYDFHFNPHYYERLFGELPNGAALVPLATALQLGLAALLTVGLATRPAAVGAAILFATFGLVQGGHQPIGLPQNFGLVGGALALALIGPGSLTLLRAAEPAANRLRWADVALRAGMALTFLAYGIGKFTDALEYQIVVAEAPLIAPMVGLVGASNAVVAVGAVEIACGLAVLVPTLVLWGLAGQLLLLVTLLAAFGYPFSYPQDLGLLGALAATILIQRLATASAPAADREAPVPSRPARRGSVVALPVAGN